MRNQDKQCPPLSSAAFCRYIAMLCNAGVSVFHVHSRFCYISSVESGVNIKFLAPSDNGRSHGNTVEVVLMKVKYYFMVALKELVVVRDSHYWGLESSVLIQDFALHQ